MKKAFTLTEILICLVIIGFMALIMLQNIRLKDFTDDAYVAQSYKILDTIQQASQQIKEAEHDMCPMGAFMINVAGTWDYAVINASAKNATSTEITAMYGNYLKYDKSVINFCDYTKYCSDSSIKGAKLPGDIYIGFEVNNAVINCPNYIQPNTATTITGNGKCWGKVYFDLDQKGPDKLGKDVFMFGLNQAGVVY